MTFKDQLIELGDKHPELQDHLRTVLDFLLREEEVGGDTETEAQAEVTEPVEDPVQGDGVFNERPLPKPPSEQTFFDKSPSSFRAFNTVILPQIQAKLDSASFQDLHQMMEEMEGLGKAKNHELESALIVFKPISMNTRRFYQEIQQVFQDWIRPKLKLQGEGFQ